MNQVEIFHEEGIYTLESKINAFGRRHKILNVSITVSKHGYTDFYAAIVLYEG